MKLIKIKSLFVVITTLILLFSFTACETTTVNVNMENTEELNNTVLGKDALIKIGNCLFYDSTTRIVYWWNGSLQEDYIHSSKYDTTPSPYYASNGLPYRYNPETNTFEEIVEE